MFVFFGSDMRVAIPATKISHIVQHDNRIDIFFNSGEYVWADDVENTAFPKLETFSLKYETKEIAEDVMRSFYVACEQNKGAFYFC